METENLNLEVLINEIMMFPTNTQTREELEKKSYLELLNIRDELYGML